MTSASGNSNSSGPGSGGGGGSAGSQTVPNRLLATLRSLNPAVRRQSSQVNHYPGSPPASAGSGGPAAVATSLGGVTTGNSSPGLGTSVSCGTPLPNAQPQQQQQQQQCLQPGSGSASQRFVPPSVAQTGGFFELPLSQQQQQQQQHQAVQSSGSEDLTSGTGSDSVVAAECLEATLAHLQHKHRRHHQHQHQHTGEKQGKQQHMFTEDFSGRRRSFAYIRTAYTKFRNVFHRRRQQQQRRSLDSALYYGVTGKGDGGWSWGRAKRGVGRGMVVGTQSLEAVEGRLYRDSVNIETCSLGSQTPRGKWLIGSDEEDCDEEHRLIDGYHQLTVDESDSEKERYNANRKNDAFDREDGYVDETRKCTERDKLIKSGCSGTVLGHETMPNANLSPSSDKPRIKSIANNASHRKPVSKDGLVYMPLCLENLDENITTEISNKDADNDWLESGGTNNKPVKSDVYGSKHVAFEEQEEHCWQGRKDKVYGISRTDGRGSNCKDVKDITLPCDIKTPGNERKTTVDNNSNYHSKAGANVVSRSAFRDQSWRSLSPTLRESFQDKKVSHDRANQNAFGSGTPIKNDNYGGFHQQHQHVCSNSEDKTGISFDSVYERHNLADVSGSLEVLQETNMPFSQSPGFSVNFSTPREPGPKFRLTTKPGNIARNFIQCELYRHGSLPSVASKSGSDLSRSDNLEHFKVLSRPQTVAFQTNSCQNGNPTSVYKSPIRSSTGLLSSMQVLPPQRPSFISPFVCSSEKQNVKKSMPCVSFLGFSQQTSETYSPCLPAANGNGSPNADDTPTTAGTLSQSWSNDTLHSGPDMIALNEIRPRSRTSEFKPNISRRVRGRASTFRDVSPRPASPTAFDLMCRCDPAENFNKYIGNLRIGGRLAQVGPNSLSTHNRNRDETGCDRGSFVDNVMFNADRNSMNETSKTPGLPGLYLGGVHRVVDAGCPGGQDLYSTGVLALNNPKSFKRRSSDSPALRRRSLSYPILQDIRDWKSEPRAR